jgi:uncharacterized protein YjbI with pentapeptide repeats
LSEVDFSYACIKNTDFSCANLYKAKFSVSMLIRSCTVVYQLHGSRLLKLFLFTHMTFGF